MRGIVGMMAFATVALAAGCGRSFAFVPVEEVLSDGGGVGPGGGPGGGTRGSGECTGAPPSCLLPPPGCKIGPACSGTTWGCSADCPDGGERQPGGGMGGSSGMGGGGVGNGGVGGLGGMGGLGGGENAGCNGAPPSFACAGGCLGTVQCAAAMWTTSCFCPNDGGACGEDPCSPCPDGCMTVAACVTGGGGGGSPLGAMGGWDCACLCGGGGGGF